MRAFATLLDRLVLTPSRNGKLKLLADYFRDTPDPDRGYGLAAIAGTLDLKSVKPALLRELVLERMDEVLFRYSYDYVGDLAETIALVWDQERKERMPDEAQPRLGAVVTRMNALGRTEVRGARSARPAGPFRPLRLHQAGDRGPAHRRLGPPCQAGARRFLR